MKTTFRSKVFHYAYEIMKATGKTWAVCLSKAWSIYRLVKAMKNRVVTFTYEKIDGSLRKAKGTLSSIGYDSKRDAKMHFSTVCYFDVEAGSFRSFRVENLISIIY